MGCVPEEGGQEQRRDGAHGHAPQGAERRHHGGGAGREDLAEGLRAAHVGLAGNLRALKQTN